MYRNLIITSLVLAASWCAGQNINFTLAEPQPDLVEVYGGSFDSGDVDGDGDIDLIMAGIDPGRETELYINDGSGNFAADMNAPFPKSSSTVTRFKDLDGDGDLDVFFAGKAVGTEGFATVYLNDGLGQFTEQVNPLLPQFADTGVDLEDVDGDGDFDIVICVIDENEDFIADVYLNDGNASFSPSGSVVFASVKFADANFIDVEDDGDFDVLVSGVQENGNKLTALYLNDGIGNFTLDTKNNFVQLAADGLAVGDTDNDGDLDLLMSGIDDAGAVRTILYINDGGGKFTELINTGLQQTFAGVNVMADLDNDGDLDFVIVGSQDGGIPNIYNIVYENIGDNEFLPADTIGGEYIAACVVDDFNGDGLADIIIQGFADKTNVYWNNSALSALTEVAESEVFNVYPNPTAGRFSVKMEDNISLYDLSIYSSQGRLISERLNVSAHDQDLQFELQSGVYIVQVRSGNSVFQHMISVIR